MLATAKLWKTLGVVAAVSCAGCMPHTDDPSSPAIPGEPPVSVGSFGAAGSPASAACGTPRRSGFLPGAAGTGGGIVRFDGPPTNADVAPPPISGGTLLTSADGSTLIAADPDRDAIYLVDVQQRTLRRRIALSAGDEPGRLVQDKSGTVHVALRGGKALASFGLQADAAVTRTPVCDLPRGLAYDAANDRVYVACAEGALVQVDPTSHRAVNQVQLGRDLRDVIVRNGQLLVSRFRSADLLTVNAADGKVMLTQRPPPTDVEEEVFSDESESCGGIGGTFKLRTNRFTSEVAWRMIDLPGRGAVMLHQRATDAEVRVSRGGYGGGGMQSCAPGIVHGALSIGDQPMRSVDLEAPGLFVDVAADPTGSMLALANPGGMGGGFSVVIVQPPSVEVAPASSLCQSAVANVRTEGQATAVSFVSPYVVAIQEREPAGITFFDVRPGGTPQRLDLKQPSRYDAGHALFHLTTSAGLACASCHAEAGDDGHTWTFEKIGPRRTQYLRGGILGTEPFHWNGDMLDFSMLVNEVFMGRMAGPQTSPEHGQAMARWIDRQPALHAEVADAAAAERGKALFESTELGCGTCHSGVRLSNLESADVGTGGTLQVPSLRAVSFRAPFMHNGCAPTLTDRFGFCGGGDKHGHTSQLDTNQVKDLVSYLESL